MSLLDKLSEGFYTVGGAIAGIVDGIKDTVPGLIETTKDRVNNDIDESIKTCEDRKEDDLKFGKVKTYSDFRKEKIKDEKNKI